MLYTLAILFSYIHFGQDINMREIDVKHRSKGGKKHRNELGCVGTIMRIDQIDSSQSKIIFFARELFHDVFQRRVMSE